MRELASVAFEATGARQSHISRQGQVAAPVCRKGSVVRTRKPAVSGLHRQYRVLYSQGHGPRQGVSNKATLGIVVSNGIKKSQGQHMYRFPWLYSSCG